MDKRGKLILWTGLAILAILNIVLLYHSQQNKVYIHKIEYIAQSYMQQNECLKLNMKYNLKFSKTIIPDIIIIDKFKSEKKLSNLFSEKSHLPILRITDEFCNTCVDYCANLFKGSCFDDIVFLIEANNYKTFENNAKNLGIIEKDIYKVEKIEMSFDKVGYPYLMVLNKNLEIEYCYFPTKGYEEIDIDNLKMIIDCYAKKYKTL